LNDSIEDRVVDLIGRAATQLPEDIRDALGSAYDNEESEIAKLNLEALLRSIEVSEKERIPICQDTGSIAFYVKSGGPIRGMQQMLSRATARATAEVPLRPNMVDVFTGKNSGTNLGELSPFVIWEDAAVSDSIELTVMLKGAGSDNQTTLAMLNPTEGIEGIERFVLKAIVEIGGKSCPPNIVGIGLGGSSDVAVFLSKKALLRPVGSRNPNMDAANLEMRLLEAINSTGIGPMGLGGRVTSLWVNIEYAHRHTASLPVGMSVSCWALRRASMSIPKSEISLIEELQGKLG